MNETFTIEELIKLKKPTATPPWIPYPGCEEDYAAESNSINAWNNAIDAIIASKNKCAQKVTSQEKSDYVHLSKGEIEEIASDKKKERELKDYFIKVDQTISNFPIHGYGDNTRELMQKLIVDDRYVFCYRLLMEWANK